MEKKAKIYKLYCEDGYYYYGHTKNDLSKRFYGHKKDSESVKYKDNKIYSHIRTIGWDKVKIILVEEVIFTTNEELRKIENKYIVDGLKDDLCLNHNRAYVSEEERKELDKIGHRKREEYKKELVKCECGIEHTMGRKEQHLKSLKHRSAMETKISHI